MRHDSPDDAWDAYEAGDYQQAARIWLALMARAQDVATHCDYQSGYCLVLMAQRQFQQALALCEEIYEITGQGIWLHHLGCLCKKTGRLASARSHFVAEQTLLKPSEHLALGFNAYQLAALAFEQGKLSLAFHYIRLSLEYARKSQNALAQCYAFGLFGRIRLALKDPEKAQDCYDAAQAALNQAPAHPILQSGEVRLAALLLEPYPHLIQRQAL